MWITFCSVATFNEWVAGALRRGWTFEATEDNQGRITVKLTGGF